MSQIIPLTNQSNQSLTVALSVDNAVLTLQLVVRYAELIGYWLMSISDSNGNLLLDSIPLVTGAWPAANLLGQYRSLQIGSAYVLNASGVAMDSPDATNLGTDFIVLWSDTPAL